MSQQNSVAPAALDTRGTETEVSFRNEDGWTLHGILSVPDGHAAEKVPAVALVPSPSHDRDVYSKNGYPSIKAAVENRKIATLRLDIRGRGRSAEPQEYHTFNRNQRAMVANDVSAA